MLHLLDDVRDHLFFVLVQLQGFLNAVVALHQLRGGRPHRDACCLGVVLNEMNKPFTAYALDSETMARWEHIIAVRTVVNGALEEARAAKVIGKRLEADVHLTVPESDRFFADESPEALADIFIVSKVELTIGDALAVKVDNAAGTKCPRCWKHSLEANAEGLCPRCAEVVKHLHLTKLL